MNARARAAWLPRDPAFWIAGAVTARHAMGVRNLRRTLAFLVQPAPDSEPTRATIHVVLPVLREQPHIAAAVAWFADLVRELPSCTVTLVTTERERWERDYLITRLAERRRGPVSSARFPQLTDAEIGDLAASRANAGDGALTRATVAEVLEGTPLTSSVVAGRLLAADVADLAISHVHYSGDGRKAAQVNHAVAGLDARDGDYVAVYDVDSRPELDLMRRTARFIEHRRSLDGRTPSVVQQPSRFTTQGKAGSPWQRSACRGAARLQTLWTMRREIPSQRRYGKVTRSPTEHRLADEVRRGLAQTVGHGLLIRLDVFRGMGGLPEFTLLEDAPFGFRLTMDSVPVHVVPGIATAAAPEQIGELLATQRRWFHNYLDYPACAAAARKGGQGSATGRAIALAVAAYRGSAWALTTPATGACLAMVVSPRAGPVARVLAAAGLWLGCVTPARMLALADGQAATPAATVLSSVELLMAYLLRGIGPFQAIALDLGGRSRRGALSPKTNRRAAETSKEVRG